MPQIKHMLVCSDLTGRSVYPLERAMQLREQAGARVSVLHVVEPGFAPKVEQRRRAEAVELLQEWRASLPESKREGVAVEIVTGEPFTSILAKAAGDGMDLVVVGQPGKRGLKELFTGTTAERIIRHSAEPVLMVNQHSAGSYKRVLVAVDFSQGARRALEWACSIATDAEIRVVHAWQAPLVSFSSKDAAELQAALERLRVQEEQQIRAIVEQVVPPTRPVRIDMVEGSPHDAVRSQIGVYNAELLAMGTHSRSRLAAAMIGSLAREFLAEGACDVLVARG